MLSHGGAGVVNSTLRAGIPPAAGLQIVTCAVFKVFTGRIGGRDSLSHKSPAANARSRRPRSQAVKLKLRVRALRHSSVEICNLKLRSQSHASKTCTHVFLGFPK